VTSGTEATLEDWRLLRVRDAYLEVFEDLAPDEQLVEWVVLAGHGGHGRRLGDRPPETLAALLEESYLAGG
jgi:hypothetical protein